MRMPPGISNSASRRKCHSFPSLRHAAGRPLRLRLRRLQACSVVAQASACGHIRHRALRSHLRLLAPTRRGATARATSVSAPLYPWRGSTFLLVIPAQSLAAARRRSRRRHREAGVEVVAVGHPRRRLELTGHRGRGRGVLSLRVFGRLRDICPFSARLRLGGLLSLKWTREAALAALPPPWGAAIHRWGRPRQPPWPLPPPRGTRRLLLGGRVCDHARARAPPSRR